MKRGLIAVGLNTYWHQFGGLRERLDGYRNAIKEKMEAYGGQIVTDAGMVDDVDKAHAAAALFRRDEAEVLFIFISTYALSSTLIPFLGEGIPVVLLNLQPAPAIDYARLNGMSDRVRFACRDVFELLPELERKGEKFDLVILDPPAFTKSRASVKKAVTGYREINLRGIKLVKNGGYLATCSCSHFATAEKFEAMRRSAAHDAGVQLRQIEARQQACDHPILWGVEETDYLKFYLFQIV